MLCIQYLNLFSGCSGNDDLGRVEVHGTVAQNGTPVARGLITFRPDRRVLGPAAGTDIVNGEYSISRNAGPAVGAYEVEIKIFDQNRHSETPHQSVMMKRQAAELTSFIEQVEIVDEINELNFSLPFNRSTVANPSR